MAKNELQKKQREQTIASVIEAASTLQNQGVALTFRAIAEEAGLSHTTLLQPDVKMALYKRFQIGQNKKRQEITDWQKQVEELKESLAKARKANADLRQQCKILRRDRDYFEMKYRHLLGQYAINIDKKIQPL